MKAEEQKLSCKASAKAAARQGTFRSASSRYGRLTLAGQVISDQAHLQPENGVHPQPTWAVTEYTLTSLLSSSDVLVSILRSTIFSKRKNSAGTHWLKLPLPADKPRPLGCLWLSSTVSSFVNFGPCSWRTGLCYPNTLSYVLQRKYASALS